jgi:general secretion pathway protein C
VQVTAQPQGGFRLSQLQPASFFARVGLRNDDVVLRVDGRPINGVDDAAAAYAWLRVTNHFSVDVIRGGRPLTLHYVITPQQPLTADAQ